MNMEPQLEHALFQLTRFTLEQGKYSDFDQFTIGLSGKLYQALSLVPEALSQYLMRQAKNYSSTQHVLLGVEVASQVSPWLSSQLSESNLAELIRSLMSILSRSEENLRLVLQKINQEVLAPLKTKLNPRKFIEFEESMGAVLYSACLGKSDYESHFEIQYIPQELWPKLNDYEILWSGPPNVDIYPFLAVRRFDDTRCLLYVSTHTQLLPLLNAEQWPIHCVELLDQGEYQQSYWFTLPSHSTLSLYNFMPQMDIYAALYAGEQLLEILATLHHIGKAYYHLTPEQVVMDQRFQLRVLPYVDSQSQRLIWTGESIDNILCPQSIYLSPEQRAGEKGDLRSDLWSFGAILYEMLTQKPLLSIHNFIEFSELKSTSGLDPFPTDIPNALHSLLKRCLNPNPDLRWSDARHVLDSYRPIAKEIRKSLQSMGRNAQWSQVIEEEHLINFLYKHKEAPPYPLSPSFFKFLQQRQVSLSTAEDPTPLLEALFAHEEALSEDIREWSNLKEEANQAQHILLDRIDKMEALSIFEKLNTLIDEKSIVLKALQQAEAKLAYFERRRPKLYQLAIQRFIKDAELSIDLKEILADEWSLGDLDVPVIKAAQPEQSGEPTEYSKSVPPSNTEESLQDLMEDFEDLTTLERITQQLQSNGQSDELDIEFDDFSGFEDFNDLPIDPFASRPLLPVIRPQRHQEAPFSTPPIALLSVTNNEIKDHFQNKNSQINDPQNNSKKVDDPAIDHRFHTKSSDLETHGYNETLTAHHSHPSSNPLNDALTTQEDQLNHLNLSSQKETSEMEVISQAHVQDHHVIQYLQNLETPPPSQKNSIYPKEVKEGLIDQEARFNKIEPLPSLENQNQSDVHTFKSEDETQNTTIQDNDQNDHEDSSLWSMPPLEPQSTPFGNDIDSLNDFNDSFLSLDDDSSIDEVSSLDEIHSIEEVAFEDDEVDHLLRTTSITSGVDQIDSVSLESHDGSQNIIKELDSDLKSVHLNSTEQPSSDLLQFSDPLQSSNLLQTSQSASPKIPVNFVLEEGENLTQLESLYDRFILLKKANEEDVSQINFTVFVAQLRKARFQYIAKHGWVALKFSVHYRAGRVAIKAKPVKL
jgi:hypothetical protein